MPTIPYLFFNGNCSDAMKFYEKTLGGTLKALMKYGETPGGAPPRSDPEQIMHAYLTLPGGDIMASDDMSGAPYQGKHGFAISINYPTAAESQRVFEALADGGTVIMPFGKTFWSDAFGIVTDRFGTPWMVSVEAPPS